MAKVFDASDINGPGICHALSATYIRASMRKGLLNAESDLGSKLGAFMAFQAVNNVDDWNALRETYHLRVTDHLSITNLNPQQNADQITGRVILGIGYRLIGIGSLTLDVQQQARVRTGHSMACRKERGVCEFYDPNCGLWRWGNSLGLHQFLPNFLLTTYRVLLGESSDVWIVEAE
jgi:hypothetical protein